MTPLQRAKHLQVHADTMETLGGREATWDEIADANLVAADAWLEAGVPEEAAHSLLQAAEYRRWALDEREDVVPGGIRRSIDWKSGENTSRLLILSLGEAAAIAKLAGWLETSHSRSSVLEPLLRVDPFGRPTAERVDWLYRMTRVPKYYPREIRDHLDRMRFRELLHAELSLREIRRDPRAPRARRR